MSATRDDSALDCVPPIVEPLVAAVRDGKDLKASLLTALQELDFNQFAMSRWNLRGDDIGSRWTAWCACQPGWHECLRHNNYGKVDPIRRVALQSGLPLVWDGSTFPRQQETQAYFSDYAAFGISSGVRMIIFRPDAEHVDFFSVTSPNRTITKAHSRLIWERMPDLWALGAFCHALLPGTAISLKGRRALGRASASEVSARRLKHAAALLLQRP